MKRANYLVAGSFLALGVYLLVSGMLLPAGMGRAPGPGFFPELIGAVIVLLALSLFLETSRLKAAGFELGNPRAVAGAIGLTFLYLLLWGTGLFPLRTAVFLALLLRFLGQRWKASLSVAAILAAAVTLAFQFGLRVSLE